MPKFASHILFAEIAKSRRPDLFQGVSLNALRFGAIGPDTTLFLFDPATSKPGVRKGISAALDVLETLQSLKERSENIVEKIKKPFDNLADWYTGGISKDLNYTVNAGLEALFLTAKLGVAVGTGTISIKNPILDKLGDLPKDFIKNPEYSASDWVISSQDDFGFPFRHFGHPYTDDGSWKQPLPVGDYSKWWWMDLLHYRKTGQFASRILQNAKSPAQRSFALGYMTHVGGDVVGHPFINALVGGPFRNHAYRHIVLETLADTWLWNHQSRGDILGSRIDQMIDLDEEAEAEIAALMISTMKDVYRAPMVPGMLKNGYPTESEFLAAFKIMKQYLRLSTGSSLRRPTPPPDDPEGIFREMKDLLRNNIPSFPSASGGNVLDFLKSLFSWAGKGLVLLVMIATFPPAFLGRILVKDARWLIYIVNLAIYYLTSSIRTMLCLAGWGYCSREDFSNFGFLEDWVFAKDYNWGEYPAKTLPDPKTPFYWLVPPKWFGNVEMGPTTALGQMGLSLTPYSMIDPNRKVQKELVLEMVNASDPRETIQLGRGFTDYETIFGNAVDFSSMLLDGEFNVRHSDGSLAVPNFDLDGDRGYGFKTWENLPPNERFI